MKPFAATITTLFLFSSGSVGVNSCRDRCALPRVMVIICDGLREAAEKTYELGVTPAEYFIGSVSIDPLFQA
jgi:hypothetical protein